MTRSARTATTAEFDLRVFFELVDRARALSSPEERGCLDLGQQVILDMVRLLHERSTTLTRQRRLFGIRTTEKLSAVFPARKPANDEAPPSTAGEPEAPPAPSTTTSSTRPPGPLDGVPVEPPAPPASPAPPGGH